MPFVLIHCPRTEFAHPGSRDGACGAAGSPPAGTTRPGVQASRGGAVRGGRHTLLARAGLAPTTTEGADVEQDDPGLLLGSGVMHPPRAGPGLGGHRWSLFYDLVYVALIARVAQGLHGEITLGALATFCVLFGLLWSAGTPCPGPPRRPWAPGRADPAADLPPDVRAGLDGGLRAGCRGRRWRGFRGEPILSSSSFCWQCVRREYRKAFFTLISRPSLPMQCAWHSRMLFCIRRTHGQSCPQWTCSAHPK